MESGQVLIATSSNDASWTDIGKTLLSASQTNLGSNFAMANDTSEQEVTPLRISLPVISKTCTVKVTFGGYASFEAGQNILRIRIGTSTSYLSNTVYQNLYAVGAQNISSLIGSVLEDFDLSTQTYVVISLENDEGHGGYLSASSARTSVIVEVYG